MRNLKWRKMFAVITSFTLALSLTPLHAVSVKAAGSVYDQFSEVDMGTEGMVVTSQPLATQVGAEVLRQGGNAMDAAVAVQLALNVVEPMMSGIGGGGFMMVYDKSADDVTILNSRERAPAGARPDMFLTPTGGIIPFATRSQHGNAVGVPGTLKGLERAVEKWGSKPLSELIAPAIKLAEEGFEVDNQLANAVRDHKTKLEKSVAKNVFVPNGVTVQKGDWLVQQDLAKTLKLIQQHGSDVLYKGEIGQAIAQVVQQYGGSMTAQDLANYTITEDQPLWDEYRGLRVAAMPPPSSGGLAVLQLLKLLDGFNIGQYGPRSEEKYHLLINAMRLAYADRAAYIGDPQYVDVPMKGMLHPEYIQKRQALINLNDVIKTGVAGDPWPYENATQPMDIVAQEENPIGQTTHFTVADKWGNVVAYTTTIEQVFGTGIMVPGYGIMLNNELTDFDATPGGANQVEPNKRPLSSMSPTIMFKDGKPILTVGSPGGATIMASVTQVILNVLDHGMELKRAIEEPRIYNTHTSDIRWELAVPADVRSALTTKGHKFESNAQVVGNVQSILIDHEKGIFYGAADSRREGAAIGIKASAPVLAPTLRLNAPSIVSTQGAFDVGVSLQNMKDLYGAAVRLQYDASKLEVVDMDPNTEGVQVLPGDWLKGIQLKNEVDQNQGLISFTAAQVGDVEGVNGEGVLATIRFKVKEGVTGIAELTPIVEEIQLLNSNNESIEFEAQSVVIEITRGVSIQGKIQTPAFQGLSDLSGFTVRLMNGQQVLGQTITNRNGDYSLSATTAGSYVLAIAKDGYLRAGAQVAVSGEQAEMPSLTLYVGDFNQDGAIDIVDITLMAKEFEKPVTAGNEIFDVNKKGDVIDLFDLVPVAKNFGKIAWDRIDQ